MKRRHDSKKTCTSSLASEFPEDCKFYPADTKDELHKVCVDYRFFNLAFNVKSPKGVIIHLAAFCFVSYLHNLMLLIAFASSYYICSSCGSLRSKGSQFLTGEVNGLT